VICEVMPEVPSQALSRRRHSSAIRRRQPDVISPFGDDEKQLASDLTSGLDNIVMKAVAKIRRSIRVCERAVS
jgi:hypothetical protein